MKIKIFIFVSLSLISCILLFQNCSPMQTKDSDSLSSKNQESAFLIETASQSDLVNILQTRGCMFNSLIYPSIADYEDNIQVLSRSSCVALPRVVETWTNPPNFAQIKNKLADLESKTGRSFLYGMFLAEAISTTAIYKDDNGQAFDFLSMCRPGTMGLWGPQTCVPDTAHPEYKRYLRYVIGKSMDVGIKDFLFGQTGHTDPNGVLADFVQEIHQMASNKGVTVIVGQQPNGIQSKEYLRAFDYVISPLYVDEDISQKCLARITTGCQAIYFHPDLASLPKKVVVELDWHGVNDDIHRLARKTAAERHNFISQRYKELTSRGVGLVLPFRIIFDGGSTTECRGYNEYVYSASRNFSCKDEMAWNQILQGNNPTTVETSPQNPTDPNVEDPPSETDNNGSDNSNNNSGPTARDIVIATYKNVMGRTQSEINNDVAGVNHWTLQVQQGLTQNQLAALFMASDEYFVRQSYLSILKRAADPAGLAYYLQQLKSGLKTRAAVQADLVHACKNHVNGECL